MSNNAHLTPPQQMNGPPTTLQLTFIGLAVFALAITAYKIAFKSKK
jgi:hypothetical protein